jgi:hypothetical protein
MIEVSPGPLAPARQAELSRPGMAAQCLPIKDRLGPSKL